MASLQGVSAQNTTFRVESGRRLVSEGRRKLVLGREFHNSWKLKREEASVSRKSFRVEAVTTPTEASPSPAPIKQVKQFTITQLTDDTFAIRGKCDERLKFEIEYGLKAGTTENLYLIKGTEGTALIDIPDQAFQDAFINTLSSHASLSSITHLVLGHLSPKRVKPLEAFLEARPENAPPIKIYCSNPSFKMVEATLPAPLVQSLSFSVVKTGETLDLGGGHKLRFILAPTPRWPDAMLTYDPANQLLFSQKFFSGHINSDQDFDIGGWDKFGTHWKFYYDCMLAPVARQTEAVLQKVPIVGQFSQPSYSGKSGLDVVKADLGYIWSTVARALNLSISQSNVLSQKISSPSDKLVVSAICPLHGPVVRSSLTELVREYKLWTSEKVSQVDETTVAVIYASAYGNTSAMAQAISKGILKAGVGCETLNCEFSTKAEIAELMKRVGGFVIGSPTLGGHMPTPVQSALGVILSDPESRTKPCGVFGSFGWSGEAVDEMEGRLRDGGFNFAFPPIRCKFKPTEQMVQTCEESGTDIAQQVRKNMRKKVVNKVPDMAVSSSVDQAVGRIVGALCVVSARSGDAESAMLASWVSQASFNPPGITLAVAKERALEGLVLPGGSFVLNVLGEKKVGPISKQLLKPFKPGEPRFGDLATEEASNGCKVLKDAVAFLECSVVSRMETGDHWVLYATVTNGNIQDEKTLTAVHYRKTGARY